MRLLVIIGLLLLAGCSTTVPVTAKFPTAPDQLLERCADLEMLPNDAKLSGVAKSVANNYTAYHECSIKHNAFIDWYHKQKKIFEDVK